MNERSLKATKVGIDKANIQIIDKAWSRQDLADEVTVGKQKGISKQPVDHFFAGRSVSRLYFVGICKELGLNWQEISGREVDEPEPTPEHPSHRTSRHQYLEAIASAQQRVWISQTWLPGIEMDSNHLCSSEATDIRLVLLSFKENSPIHARLLGRSMSIERAQNNSASSVKAFTDCERFERIRFNYGHHPGWIAVVDRLVFCGPTPVDTDSHSAEFLFQKYADDSAEGNFWLSQFETIWNNYSHTFEEETNYNRILLELTQSSHTVAS